MTCANASCGRDFTPKYNRVVQPARFCCASCRREGYRLAKLARGEADGHYRSLEQYLARRMRASSTDVLRAGWTRQA